MLQTGLNVPRALSGSRPTARTRASSQPAPHTKSVQFDLGTSVPNTPAQIRKRRERTGPNHHHDAAHDSENSYGSDRHRRSRQRRYHSDDESRSPSPAGSDETIVLPDRFDPEGRRKPEMGGSEKGENPLIETLDGLFGGKVPVKKLIDSFFGSNDSESDGERDRHPGRRRRRH